MFAPGSTTRKMRPATSNPRSSRFQDSTDPVRRVAWLGFVLSSVTNVTGRGMGRSSTCPPEQPASTKTQSASVTAVFLIETILMLGSLDAQRRMGGRRQPMPGSWTWECLCSGKSERSGVGNRTSENGSENDFLPAGFSGRREAGEPRSAGRPDTSSRSLRKSLLSRRAAAFLRKGSPGNRTGGAGNREGRRVAG